MENTTVLPNNELTEELIADLNFALEQVERGEVFI